MPLFANSETEVQLAINKDINLVNAGTLNNIFSISMIYNFNTITWTSWKQPCFSVPKVGIIERPFPVITIESFAVWTWHELKRHEGHGSSMLIASLQALLSKATSFDIFQSLRSLLTNSFQVSLGLHLFTLSARFRTPLVRIRRSLLDMSKPPQLMLGKLLLN